MRCLVTGAAGFIGSSLCDRLLSLGHTVVGVDCFVDYYPREFKERNLSFARECSKFSFIEGNLNTLALEPLVAGVDWVFHQAAQAGVRASWGSYFSSYVENNIIATQKLLEAIKSQPAVKKIVFASSSSVYGNAETAPTHERVLPQPVSPYGVTKLSSEELMVLYAVESGLPTVSLRYFTVFGPRQRPDMAFNRFIRSALMQQEIRVFGDGEQSRDFTFVSDVVDANLLAAEKGKAGSVVNIGGGPHATVNQVLSRLEANIGPLRVKKEGRQKGDARHTYADITFAKETLGFQPVVTLEDGLVSEISWVEQELRQFPKAWTALKY